MGRRSRKRRPDEAAAAGATTAPYAAAEHRAAEPTATDRAARTEAKNAALRESLEPLAPGERPAAVTVAAIIAALLGLANLVLLATGYEVRGGEDSGGPVGVILFAVIMAAAAVGLWRSRYWAVLGFQALLAITVLIAALSLGVASNALAVVLCTAIVIAGGLLFYKLIRAMARIQMPARPGR